MKTSHFEGHIALRVVGTAQSRDEHTQREPATFDFDLGSAWLVAPAFSRELDLNRETVGRYLRVARSKQAISTAGVAAKVAACLGRRRVSDLRQSRRLEIA